MQGPSMFERDSHINCYAENAHNCFFGANRESSRARALYLDRTTRSAKDPQHASVSPLFWHARVLRSILHPILIKPLTKQYFLS